jgi:hypothetical protein
MIFAALFVQQWQVGLGCLLGGSIATVAELVREKRESRPLQFQILIPRAAASSGEEP